MALDPVMQAGFAADVIHAFVAVDIQHPVGTIRLLKGAGFLTFGGNTYRGYIDSIGSLGNIGIDDEGSGDEAPEAQIDILPADMTVGGIYGVPSAQGGRVIIWSGLFNPVTGAVVGTPDARYIGEIDTIDWQRGAAGSGEAVLRIGVVSGFDRFFDLDEGARLSDAYHQSIWPGEKGFEYLTTILDNMPWGAEGPRPQVVVPNKAPHGMVRRVVDKAVNAAR